MAVPSRDMPTFVSTAAQIAAPTSSVALATPIKEAINHLGGYIMRGTIHHQWRDRAPTATAEIGRFYTHRNPNCDYLYCWALVDNVQSNAPSFSITAGGGAASTTTYLASTRVVELIAAWDSGDSGWQEVTYTTSQCGIRAVMVGELYRQTLGSGDDVVEIIDAANPLGGLLEAQYVMDSTVAGPEAMIQETRDVWNNNLKQAVSWCEPIAASHPTATAVAASWENPFPLSRTFRHQARQKAAEATRDYTVWAYTRTAPADPGVEYTWRVSSAVGGDSVTKTGLTNTSIAWTSSSGLAIATGSVDTLTFDMQITANDPGVMYVGAVSIIEG